MTLPSGRIWVDGKVPVDPKGQPRIEDISPFIEEGPWSGDYAVFNMLIYGEPGEGKTPLVATVVQVPEMMPALLIDCDSGTLSARDYDTLNTVHLIQLARQKRISPWRALELVYAWLLYAKHDYRTIILDGGTDLQRFCELECIAVGKELRADSGKEHDEELAELSDYRRIQERMKRTYTRFRDLITVEGRRVNFLATAHEGKLKDNWTGEVTIQPLYLGRGAPIISSIFDIVARLVTDEKGVKYLVPRLVGKARGRDRSLSLGDRIPNPSMREVYKRILQSEERRKKHASSG